jgi:hypothetical protein
MSIAKDVTVNIQRLTQGIAAPNFGLTLLVTTETTKAYAEYGSIAAVQTIGGFNANSSAYKMAAAYFGKSPKPEKVAIVGIQQAFDFSDVINGLGLVVAAQNGWYYLVCDNNMPDAIAALATFAAANSKMYFTCLAKADLGTTVSPNNDRAVILVSDNRAEYPEAAWIGKVSTFAPGSATWKFKTLSGVTPVPFDDQATEVDTITGLNMNTYVAKYGLNQTTEGLTTSGEYIDIMLAVDWLQAEMEGRIGALFVRNAKVPYTNEGIAMIASEVDGVLRTATAMNIIRKTDSGNGVYDILIPDISAVNPNDVANREFRDLTWAATLAGAIHEVVINGTVSYVDAGGEGGNE